MRILLAVVLALGLAGLPTARAADDAVHLFNGKDLGGFYTFFKDHGKNNDPEKVFTVQDGVIRVSGTVWGYLATEKEYDNYHLVVEFKWGEQTGPKRKDQARDSGVLLHAVGEDGAVGNWMKSIECQMIEGGTGDFILVGGTEITAPVEQRGKDFYYKKGAPEKEFKKGRINWYGRDPNWKDVKGFRGSEDVEKPAGDWNKLECICDGDKITIVLNGKVVNEGRGARPSKGKILLQSEGAEVFFRKVDLTPLKK